MRSYSNLREILDWILKSGKSASAILTVLVEIVLEWVGESFVILDKKRAEMLIKSDIGSLLHEIATKKRKSISFSFFFTRMKRIALNLWQAGLLAPKRYFSEIEQSNPENNEFLDFFSKIMVYRPNMFSFARRRGEERAKTEGKMRINTI